MDKRAKGLRIQRKAREFLEKEGYLVYIIHHTRWSKDIFGLFDGFAIKPSFIRSVTVKDGGKEKIVIKDPPEVLFFQVKANSFPKKEPYVEFSRKYSLKVWLMKWIDRKGWEIYEIDCGRQCLREHGIR